MKKKLLASGVAVAAAVLLYGAFAARHPAPGNTTEAGAPPVMVPDYTGIVIPPNIAPLNFRIREEDGCAFHVKISSEKGRPVTVSSSGSLIRIPGKRWKRLLQRNRGAPLRIDVYVKKSGGVWKHYRTITDTIANEEIDGYLVYRLINPGYRLWEDMGIYCRNLSGYDEKTVVANTIVGKNCINCHSFCANDPRRALFHIRGKMSGTVIVNNGHIRKIDTKTAHTLSAGVYPSWHPGGNLIAFSVNKISQEFYSAGPRSINVFDRASDLVVYDTERNIVTTSPEIATQDFENMPAWSPDGTFLYFCSARRPEKGHATDSVRYSLMRIPYDAPGNTWGAVDTVLSSSVTGMSISWPRPSPDGRFLLFCMSDYGYFSIHNPASDLYMMDLKTGTYRLLGCSSDRVDSHHSWSHNGRWFVFSSKCGNGLCAWPYFAYFDSAGIVGKPFVLPQKDPSFYDTFLKSYNVPELVKAPWRLDKWNLYRAVRSAPVAAGFDEMVDPDVLSGATKDTTGSGNDVRY